MHYTYNADFESDKPKNSRNGITVNSKYVILHDQVLLISGEACNDTNIHIRSASEKTVYTQNDKQ